MNPGGRALSRIIALGCAAFAFGCAAPRLLYDGPPLPREKVALLRGFPFMSYREGRSGRGNSVAASGKVVVIGLDGRVFNAKVYAAYSGDDFILLPGRHSLLAYCEYNPHDGGPVRTLYSDLFTIAFTAKAGREYRYQADFYLARTDGGASSRHAGLLAHAGVWDVTENRSADSSNRVNEGAPGVPVTFRTLTHIQATVGTR